VPEPPRFYLDSNVYLAWLRGEAGRVDTARELLTAGEEHRLTIVASTLVYAEVCGHGEVRSATAEGVDAKIRTFFERGFLRWVEVDLPNARHARMLSRAHGLRGADAIHLSSAIRAKAERFMTWDMKDFPIGQVIEGVAVQKPEAYGQGTLPVA
jgi:predicted nucleic acid-binding protein